MKQKTFTFIIVFIITFVVLFYVEEFKEINSIIRLGLAFAAGVVGVWNCKEY